MISPFGSFQLMDASGGVGSFLLSSSKNKEWWLSALKWITKFGEDLVSKIRHQHLNSWHIKYPMQNNISAYLGTKIDI
jgi:hypothetical protein